jgi:flagellar hook protein FlgE
MSLFGSLFSGVSALNAQSQAMAMISDNISNVNTVGYKATTAAFETLVTSSSSDTTFTPGGVRARSVALIDHQGLVQSSASPTDLAIAGQGFFVVQSTAAAGGNVQFTRAGSFRPDSLGNLSNTAGFFLQGWPLDANGRLPGEPGNVTNTTSFADLASVTTVNVNAISGVAASTSVVSMGANLTASQVVLPGPQGTSIQQSISATTDMATAFSLTDGDSFTVTNGASVTGTFEYDPLPAGASLRNGLTVGNKVEAADGLQAINIDLTEGDDAFKVSYVNGTRSLTMTRVSDGTAQTIVLAAGAIGVGLTETANFTTFGTTSIILDSTFNKGADITLAADASSITIGTGVINDGTITISGSTGNTSAITSSTLTFGALGTPAAITVTSGSFAGSFDGTGTGVKTVNLTDGNGNTLQVQFDVTTVFDGNETAASITLNELQNLAIVKAAGANEYSTLTDLAAKVNAATGLTATLGGGASDATLTLIGDDSRQNLVLAENTGTPSQSIFGAVSPVALTYDPAASATNMASGSISAHFSRAVRVFDSQGTGHDLQVGFVKVTSNTWEVEVFALPASEVTVTSPLVDGQIATGTITFNGDGSLGSISTGLTGAKTLTWTNGASPSAIALDLGTAGAQGIGQTDGLSQFDGGFNVSFVNQNGSEVGELNGISISEEGFVIAAFTNGETQKVFKIPIATFTDASKLGARNGNVFTQTEGSGQFNLREAGKGGSGLVAPSALESANVDLGKEFTDMIITQRAFSASSKVITTVDEMLDELIRIRR